MTPDASGPSSAKTITVFTIGFTQKTARAFFETLARAGVKRVIDVRLNNDSQLAAFSKKDDLTYFLEAITAIGYVHRPDLAPTKDILDDYKKKRLDWAGYETRFIELLRERHAENLLDPAELDRACLLCSEPKADKCHRRLVAEYIRDQWGGVEVRHL